MLQRMPALQSRWGQLVIGIVCMVMIANLQYGWTLFVLPIGLAHGWSRAAIQVAFIVFVLCETWLLPLEGYVIDRIGPKLTVCAGGVLVGASWVVDSMAGSLFALKPLRRAFIGRSMLARAEERIAAATAPLPVL